MITVTAPLWIWNEGTGSWHFITVPPEEACELRAHGLTERRGFGSVRVEAPIGGVAWRTSVFPQKSGGYLLPVKAAVRPRPTSPPATRSRSRSSRPDRRRISTRKIGFRLRAFSRLFELMKRCWQSDAANPR